MARALCLTCVAGRVGGGVLRRRWLGVGAGVIDERRRIGDSVASAVVAHEVLHVTLDLELLQSKTELLAGLSEVLSVYGMNINGKPRTSSSETQTVDTAFAYAHMLSFMNSIRSSSRS